MKFAEHLGAHITPEWRKQYIQYEEMKVSTFCFMISYIILLILYIRKNQNTSVTYDVLLAIKHINIML